MPSAHRLLLSLLLAAPTLASVITPGAGRDRTSTPDSALPAPSGPYPVGRAEYTWIDPNRTDPYAEQPGEPRRLVAWIWYPAAATGGTTTAAYSPPGWEATGEFWGFDHEAAVSRAIAGAPVATTRDQYPVLLFSGNGFPALTHTAMLEDVASHGYVVVGVTHSGQTPVTVFADGTAAPMAPSFSQSFFGPFTGPVEEVLRHREQIVATKVADLQAVINHLEALPGSADPLGGRLDLDRLGAFGHSMGGNAALELCRIDRRCLAAANLDGANWTEVGRSGLTKPALFITVERAEEGPCQESEVYPAALCEADHAIGANGWRKVAETAQPSYTVTVAGAAHLSFLDIPFLTATPGGMIASAGGNATIIDPVRMWRITGDYLLAFFAAHLSGQEAPLLASGAVTEPEVTLAIGSQP